MLDKWLYSAYLQWLLIVKLEVTTIKDDTIGFFFDRSLLFDDQTTTGCNFNF